MLRPLRLQSGLLEAGEFGLDFWKGRVANVGASVVCIMCCVVGGIGAV